MRVILADHHEYSRWAIQLMLSEQPQIELVGVALDAQGLLDQVNHSTAHLVLLDCDLPGLPVEALIAQLCSLDPRPVVVAMSSDMENGLKLLDAGADAYVNKAEQCDCLLKTLEKYASQISSKEDANQTIISESHAGPGAFGSLMA
jgi:DNA-binding NarL/FixJ family response regulator